MDWINEKAKTLRQGAIRAMFDKASTMDNVISMGIGEPDMATPELVCRAGNEALEKGITHYTPNAGTPALRRAIAEKSNLKGVGYDPTTEIIITNGGMGALSLLFLVLLNPGDEVLIQDPQWLNYVAQVRYCGGEAVRVPTDLEHNFTMQPEAIEQRITPRTKALMINSPNNPTGSVMSRGHGADRRDRQKARPAHHRRRGLQHPALRHGAVPVHRGAARHEGPLRGDQQLLKILRHDRLAHRLSGRPRGDRRPHDQMSGKLQRLRKCHRSVRRGCRT